VLIAGSDYTSYGTNVTISSSGTPTEPITFASAGAPYFLMSDLKVSGSYIVLNGGDFGGFPDAAATVTGAHVTFDHDVFYGNGSDLVQTGANVTSLTIERSNLTDVLNSPLIDLGSGDTGTVLSTNVLGVGTGDLTPVGSTGPKTTAGPDAPAVIVSGDSNTDITGNTIIAECFTGVSVADSIGTSIENNVIGDESCHSSGHQDVAVDAASAPSTTEGYNLLSEDSGGVTLYGWAGKTYSTQSAFAAATGQGSADIAESSVGINAGAGDSDAVSDANASAPGELTTDFYGNTWPDASPDRGAVAVAVAVAVAGQDEYDPTLTAVAYTPQQVEIALDMHSPEMPGTNVTVNWGDGSAPTVGDPVTGQAWSNFTDIPENHIYVQRGTYTVTMSWVDGDQTVTETTTVTTDGGTYVPVNPSRILDTRDGTGAPEAMVGPHDTIAVNVTNGVTVPKDMGTITAVVMNVTATDETTIGVVTVYPDGTPLPTTSNLNYAAKQNIPNLVTVKVGADDKVDFNNGSAGSTDLVADVEGYYVDSSAGAYYLPNAPQRILDTRNGTGATGPVAPGGTVAVSVPNCTSNGVSAPTTAVAVNVTVANPASIGLITAYPDQSDLPIASNINYAAHENVPNMVVVEVGADGKFDLHNTSNGTVQLIADLEGCYSATLGGAFFPVDPYRALDTRTGIGQVEGQPQTVAPDSVAQWYSQTNATYTGSQAPAAVVMNVTVTDPQTIGVITAYPGTGNLPIASNLNFSGGETVPNLVMVPASGGDVNLYNGSKGTVQLVADVYGYFS
jgi:hypothetical protein